MTSAIRIARVAVLAAVAASLLAGCAATRQHQRTDAPPSPTAPAATPAPTEPLATPDPTDPAVPPLPPDLRIPDDAGFGVSATSAPGVTVGEAFLFSLGHCGLYSPVDVDGSLWEPVGGHDAQGGPIDTDAEVGQLITETAGEAMLVNRVRLDYRSERGVVVVFRRLDGPRMYPGCQ
jgi:hypothetical protein